MKRFLGTFRLNLKDIVPKNSFKPDFLFKKKKNKKQKKKNEITSFWIGKIQTWNRKGRTYFVYFSLCTTMILAPKSKICTWNTSFKNNNYCFLMQHYQVFWVVFINHQQKSLSQNCPGSCLPSLANLFTVETRLSGLVGTSVKSPDNRESG